MDTFSFLVIVYQYFLYALSDMLSSGYMFSHYNPEALPFLPHSIQGHWVISISVFTLSYVIKLTEFSDMLWNWCGPSVAICIRGRKNKHQRLCFTGDGEELLTALTSDDVQMLQDSWLTQKEASPSTSLATGSILSCAAPLAMLFACGIWENIFDICCY